MERYISEPLYMYSQGKHAHIAVSTSTLPARLLFSFFLINEKERMLDDDMFMVNTYKS
jgi:hypothetical protein